jgi:hypothetical protein
MFDIKILDKHKGTYAELDQPNPLRWRIMHRKGDTLVSQSCMLKCKDFFNDVVAWKKAKKSFVIYGFNNNIKFNKEGLYLYLTEISNPDMFLYNLFIVDERMIADLGVEIEYVAREDNTVVVLIPHKLFSSTYYISLLTMLIRLCNYNIRYEDWDSFFDKKAPINTIEEAFTDRAIAFAQKNGFKLLTKYRKLWYNSTNGWNSEADKPLTASVIHNNGVCDWVKSMEAK